MTTFDNIFPVSLVWLLRCSSRIQCTIFREFLCENIETNVMMIAHVVGASITQLQFLTHILFHVRAFFYEFNSWRHSVHVFFFSLCVRQSICFTILVVDRNPGKIGDFCFVIAAVVFVTISIARNGATWSSKIYLFDIALVLIPINTISIVTRFITYSTRCPSW